MTAVLDRPDVDFLAKEIRGFEDLCGEVLTDGEVPEAYSCLGGCSGSCWDGCYGGCKWTCAGGVCDRM